MDEEELEGKSKGCDGLKTMNKGKCRCVLSVARTMDSLGDINEKLGESKFRPWDNVRDEDILEAVNNLEEIEGECGVRLGPEITRLKKKLMERNQDPEILESVIISKLEKCR